MAGRDLPVLFCLIYKHLGRRDSARQPSSFSLLEPQRKRTKRNDSLAASMTVHLVGSSTE